MSPETVRQDGLPTDHATRTHLRSVDTGTPAAATADGTPPPYGYFVFPPTFQEGPGGIVLAGTRLGASPEKGRRREFPGTNRADYEGMRAVAIGWQVGLPVLFEDPTGANQGRILSSLTSHLGWDVLPIDCTDESKVHVIHTAETRPLLSQGVRTDRDQPTTVIHLSNLDLANPYGVRYIENLLRTLGRGEEATLEYIDIYRNRSKIPIDPEHTKIVATISPGGSTGVDRSLVWRFLHYNDSRPATRANLADIQSVYDYHAGQPVPDLGLPILIPRETPLEREAIPSCFEGPNGSSFEDFTGKAAALHRTVTTYLDSHHLGHRQRVAPVMDDVQQHDRVLEFLRKYVGPQGEMPVIPVFELLYASPFPPQEKAWIQGRIDHYFGDPTMRKLEREDPNPQARPQPRDIWLDKLIGKLGPESLIAAGFAAATIVVLKERSGR